MNLPAKKIAMIKDLYNCEMCMCGTVKCRPTLAYRVHNKSTFGECARLAGKALTVNMLKVNCFQTPTVTQPFMFQRKAHMREMVNYFLIDVAQVYRVYMTWGLALNAAMGMKRI